ncbi:EamA family transporter [Dongia sp.]|uniref:EamA family transporter n=1 Tax=Dongia sp. TaxID=1977262 RepID=UPI0035B43923
MYPLSITIAIVSQVLYHVAQKAMPSGTRPFLLLAVVYAIATVSCVCLSFVGAKSMTMSDLKPLLSWPVLLLTASVVGIEIGYLLAYRQGWSIGLAFSVASTATVILLAIIGFLALSESLNKWQMSGLGLALVGTWLVVFHQK